MKDFCRGHTRRGSVLSTANIVNACPIPGTGEVTVDVTLAMPSRSLRSHTQKAWKMGHHVSPLKELQEP